MGNGAAIHNIEVSFIDDKTGVMLDDKKINDLIDKSFDLSQKFYENHNDPKKLAQLAEYYNNIKKKSN